MKELIEQIERQTEQIKEITEYIKSLPVLEPVENPEPVDNEYFYIDEFSEIKAKHPDDAVGQLEEAINGLDGAECICIELLNSTTIEAYIVLSHRNEFFDFVFESETVHKFYTIKQGI